MSKVIFVLHRRPDQTHEQCLAYWGGEQHTSIVSALPGLRAWVQNHVASAPGEPVCDGIGELWFDTAHDLQESLASPEMAAALDDAKNFLDMNRTGMVIVDEKTVLSITSSEERNLHEWAASWSTGDAERLLSLFTDDCVYEDVTMGVVTHGKEELRAFATGIFDAFPDFKVELTSQFATDSWGGMEWNMSGTQQGDLPGLPASGNRFTLRGSTILELRQDAIARCTDYWDMATLQQQLQPAAAR